MCLTSNTSWPQGIRGASLRICHNGVIFLLYITGILHTLTPKGENWVLNVWTWNIVIFSNFSFSSVSRVGANLTPLYINMVRDPLERLVSHYYFLRYIVLLSSWSSLSSQYQVRGWRPGEQGQGQGGRHHHLRRVRGQAAVPGLRAQEDVDSGDWAMYSLFWLLICTV